MATYYWVGGSGNWDSTATHWSLTSGGAGGAGVPTAADSLIFNAASNATGYTVTITPDAIFTASISGTTLTVTAVASGTIAVGQRINAFGIDPSLTITALGTGSGGTGTYTISASASANSQTFNANCPICNTISVAAPASGAVAFAGSAYWHIQGGFALPATNCTIDGNLGIIFNTNRAVNFATNGVQLGTIQLWGYAGTPTLNFSTAASIVAIYMYSMGFTTNNYTLTSWLVSSQSSNANISVSLGSSTVNMINNSGFNLTAGNTLNAGTSTINFAGGTPSVGGTGTSPVFTYYNVSFNNTTTSIVTVNGSNTFNNFSVATVTSANGISYLYFTGNQTINGTLTISGASYNQRLQVYDGPSATSLLSTNVTLTVNAVSSLSYIDFGGITVAGASSPWSGTSIGDLQGNINITTTPSKIVYWYAPNATGQWGGNTPFATTSGGTTAAANFPLAQDTVIFDNTGLGTGGVVNYDRGWALGRLDFSRVTNAATFSMNSYPAFYLDVIFSSSLTLTQAVGSSALFYCKGTQTLVSAGLTFPAGLVAGISNRASSTLTLAGAAGALNWGINAGVLNLNNNSLTIGNNFFSNNSFTRTIAFGTGAIYLTGNNAELWTVANTGLTITGTKNVYFTYSGSTGTRSFLHGASGGATAGNAVNILVTAGTDSITVSNNGASNINNFNLTGFKGTYITYSLNIYGDLTFDSGMVGTTATANNFQFIGTGTQNITANGIALQQNVYFGGTGTYILNGSFSSATGGYTTYLTFGTLNLNGYSLTTFAFNTNNANTRSIAFNSGAIYLTGNNTTIWESGNQTNFSYTGTSAIYCTYSGSTGSRGISAGITSGTQSNALNFSVTAGSDTVIFYGTGRVYNSINLTGFSGTLSSDNWAYYVYGTLTIPNGISTSTTVSYSGPIYLAASSGIQNIDTNGVTIPAPVTASGNATYTLLSNLVVASTTSFSLNSGSLSLNGKTLTCGAFSANSSAVTIAFGTSGIYITGNNTTVFSHNGNISYTGTPNFYFTYSGSTGTRTISGGLQTYPLNYYITAGTDTVTLGISTYYNTINFTGFSGTLSALTGSWNLQGDLVLSSTMTFTDSPSGNIQLAPATSQNLTTNGTSIKTYLFIFGPGTIVLQGAATTTYVFSLSGGTLNLNGYNFTPSTFLSPTSSTKSIVFGGATITIPSGGGAAVWNNTGTNFSTSGTGKISFTASTNKTFYGGGANYPTISQDGSGILYINGNNTYQNMTATVFPSTITFGAGGTHSFNNFSVIGTAGNLVTVNSSTSGTAANFVNLSGHNLGGNYMSLQDTNVTPVNTWYAGRNTTNVSNNTGWVFYNYYPVTATENATMADAETNTAKFISSVLEAFTPADTDTLGQAKYNVITTETSSLLDRITTSAKFGSAVVEALTALSAQVGNAKFVVTRTDNSTMTDAETNVKNLYSAVLENSGLANSQTNIAKYSRAVVENFAPASTQSNTVKYNSAVIETVVTFDTSIGRGWFKIVDSQNPNWTVINDSQL